jgi:mRNA-degrading endonuclease toxin of MazEF toxin-antitoxin module
MERPMNFGDIVHLSWTPQAGNEMARDHYGVVISCAQFNELIPRVVVAPITSKNHPEFGRLRIPIQSSQSSLTGFICLDHIRTIDPIARNLTQTGDQITSACRKECKMSLSKIFSIN